jgi:hypothetical protein
MTAPWLFWGSDQTLAFRSVGLSMNPIVPSVSPQIARIDFGRPETWTFFIGAKLESLTPFPPAGVTYNIEINFIATIGLARTSRALNLGPLTFAVSGDVAPSVSPTVGLMAWATQTRSPVRIPADPAVPGHFALLDSFPAQSINCVATARPIATPAPEPFSGVLTVTALFAPRTHVRPEWFKDGRFTAGEDYGT